MTVTESDGSDRSVGSLARGLHILSLFDVDTPQMSFVEIHNRSGLAKATVHRILKTLVASEFIVFDEHSRRYHPAPRVMTLGFSAMNAFGLVDNARPVMEAVARSIEQTVGLNIQDDTDIVNCYRVIPPCNIVSVNIPIGYRSPVAGTGSGRLFMAFDTSDDARNRLEAIAAPFTSDARQRLYDGLAFARTHKFSFNDEDTALGYRSVCVPVWRLGNQITAALYVSAASSQMGLTELIRTAVPPLREASTTLSLVLGASKEFMAQQEPVLPD